MTDPAHVESLMRGVIAYINVPGATEAIEFYKKAFGAIEHRRMMAEDGKRIMHCELEINGGIMMVSDVFPEHGYGHEPSHSFTMTLVLREGGDEWWTRAVEAGCEVTMPFALQFWGDRYGQLKDAFGVRWAMNQPGTPQP